MSRARELSRLGNPNIISADSSFNVGFGTATPKEKVNVVGVVSATSFFGDGSGLDGIASAGIGTALSDDKTKALNTIYFTNDEVVVTNNSTVNPPASGHIAYTQAPTVVIDDTKELIISDGDDLLVDVLGISTGTNVDYAARGNGVFDNIYVDNIESSGGQTSVNFPKGLVSTGVATFHSDVSIGGTLTYEDVKNIDSVGLITARTGIKVSAGGIDVAGGGIDVVGDIGLGAGKQTGTAGQLLTSGGAGADASWTSISSSPEYTGISSGSITAGRGVIVADDGKLMNITGFNGARGTIAATAGTNTARFDIVYSTGSDKFVVFYRDADDGGKGKASVGTQNGTTITWATPVEFSANNISQGGSFVHGLYDSYRDKVVVAYKDSNNKASVCVGAISGTSITFGTPNTNLTGSESGGGGSMEYSSFCYCDDTYNYAIVYNSSTGNKGWCKIGKYDGTNSSTFPNSSVQFLNGQARETGCWYDTTANKLVIATNNGAQANFAYIFAGTVANDSVTFGSGQQVETNPSGADLKPSGCHDPDTGKNIICWVGDSYHGYVKTATLSGTTFTFGASEYEFNPTGTTTSPKIGYDPASKKFLISYGSNYSSSVHFETLQATLSGTTITFDTKYVVSNTPAVDFVSAGLAYSPDTKSFVTIFRSGNAATYYVENIRTSNVTAGNYIGIANASYTNGQTASISIPGAVNTAVSGLTIGQKYYIEADGTLNTTADVANIVAGNAAAANKLIVR